MHPRILTNNRARRRNRLRLPLVFLLILFIVLWPAFASSQDKELVPREYGLKAVYLFNFLQFVHWPEKKCPVTGGKIKEIAVLGDSPIGESLKALQAELQRTDQPAITLRFLGPYTKGMDLSGCRLLFITQAEMKNIRMILDSVRDEAVLTVSDTEDCLVQGCMIALISRMNKVRWAVNRGSAEQSGLRLNSRLLAMAVDIIDSSNGLEKSQ